MTEDEKQRLKNAVLFKMPLTDKELEENLVPGFFLALGLAGVLIIVALLLG